MRTPQSRVTVALAAALAGVIVHAFVRFADKALMYLRSPYTRDPGEGAVLAMVELLDERGNYFLDMRDYPFAHLNYPPVFPGLVWPFFHFLGPSLFVPRLLSTLATLGIVAAVFGLARTATGSRALAAAAAGISLGPWFLQTWAPMARVDMLAIFFSLAGLYAYLRGVRLALVFPLFWLGFFTKQNALLAPAAVLLSLAATGKPRDLMRAAAGFAVPLLGLFAVLQWATDGYAYRHLVTYTAAAAYHPDEIAPAYGTLARTAWPLFAIILAAAARDPREMLGARLRPLVLYWMLALAGLATIAKEGSGRNYLIEPWLATVLLAAVALPIAAAGREGAAPIAVGLVAAAVGHYTGFHHLPAAIENPDDAVAFRRLWQVVGETEGPILSENLAPIVIQRKAILADAFGLLVLRRAGLVRTRPIARDCEAHAFSLVIVERLLEEVPGLGECLAAHYREEESLPPYRLLRPNPALAPIAPP